MSTRSFGAAITPAGLATLLVLTSVACVTGRTPSRPPGEAPADSIVFRAAVTALRDSSGVVLKWLVNPTAARRALYTLTVDPRPHLMRPMDVASWPWIPTNADLDAASRGIAESRARQLEVLGIPLGDLPALDVCPGGASPGHELAKCPREPRWVAILSSPRMDGDRAVVQAYHLLADPRGKMGYAYRMYFRRHDGSWMLDEQSLGIIVE